LILLGTALAVIRILVCFEALWVKFKEKIARSKNWGVDVGGMIVALRLVGAAYVPG